MDRLKSMSPKCVFGTGTIFHLRHFRPPPQLPHYTVLSASLIGSKLSAATEYTEPQILLQHLCNIPHIVKKNE